MTITFPTWDTAKSAKTFVALHPFLMIPGYSPTRDSGSRYTVTPAGKILGQAPDYVRKNPWSVQHLPSKEEVHKRYAMGTLTKTSARNIRWEDIRQGGGFRSLESIQRALFSIVARQAASSADSQALFALTDYCDKKEIFFPTDGFIPPSLEKPFGQLLQLVDKREFIAADEFDIQQAIVDSDKLLNPTSVVLELPLSIRGTIAATRFTTIDGHLQCRAMEGLFYTVIKTDNQKACAIIPTLFDGFWCSAEQMDSWWLPTIRAAPPSNQ
jgi:hypothetical protein